MNSLNYLSAIAEKNRFAPDDELIAVSNQLLQDCSSESASLLQRTRVLRLALVAQIAVTLALMVGVSVRLSGGLSEEPVGCSACSEEGPEPSESGLFGGGQERPLQAVSGKPNRSLTDE